MSCRRVRLDIMMSTTPIIATTGAKFSGLSRSSTPPPSTPERLRIQFVTVVPRLEPMIKLMVCGNCIRPELTRPTSMTVIAEEDWIAIVIPAPSSVLEKGLEETFFRELSSEPPATLPRPPDITFIP